MADSVPGSSDAGPFKDGINDYVVHGNKGAVSSEGRGTKAAAYYKLKIPAGTQNGKKIRIKGKGIPHLHGGGRGDQHIIVTVEVPTDLSAKQRELLEKFAEISGEDSHPQSKSFFSKVRELFG